MCPNYRLYSPGIYHLMKGSRMNKLKLMQVNVALAFLIVAVFFYWLGRHTQSGTVTPDVQLRTQMDSTSYIEGMDIAKEIRRQKVEVVPNILAKGMVDVLDSNKTLLTEDVEEASAQTQAQQGATQETTQPVLNVISSKLYDSLKFLCRPDQPSIGIDDLRKILGASLCGGDEVPRIDPAEEYGINGIKYHWLFEDGRLVELQSKMGLGIDPLKLVSRIRVTKEPRFSNDMRIIGYDEHDTNTCDAYPVNLKVNSPKVDSGGSELQHTSVEQETPSSIDQRNTRLYGRWDFITTFAVGAGGCEGGLVISQHNFKIRIFCPPEYTTSRDWHIINIKWMSNDEATITCDETEVKVLLDHNYLQITKLSNRQDPEAGLLVYHKFIKHFED